MCRYFKAIVTTVRLNYYHYFFYLDICQKSFWQEINILQNKILIHVCCFSATGNKLCSFRHKASLKRWKQSLYLTPPILYCDSMSCRGQRACSLQGSLIQEAGSFSQHMPSSLLMTFIFHCGDAVWNSNSAWISSRAISGAVILCSGMTFCHIPKARGFCLHLCLQSQFVAASW